ncbi:hypothetical protein BDZ85DRAFT_15392 [Elsinoe ampelina]|uniref:Uncharacterized protein n=1 Tax=Elsinoe ampelina TaxID=302913 RepID=A0A6A6G6X1_9PEZI|nr:hypothetical protein BDZ85DRAFT_15392 [Elsinoe ampelina]
MADAADQISRRKVFSQQTRLDVDKETSPFELLALARRFTDNTSRRLSLAPANGLDAELFAWDCRDIFYMYVRLVEVADLGADVVDSAVVSIIATRELGSLPLDSNARDGSTAARVSRAIWGDLPFLVEALDAALDSRSGKARLKLVHFAAKLMVVGIHTERMAPLMIRDLDAMEGELVPNAGSLLDVLTAAEIWVRTAAQKTLTLAKRKIADVDVRKWSAWKAALGAVDDGQRKGEVIEVAKRALFHMQQSERFLAPEMETQ